MSAIMHCNRCGRKILWVGRRAYDTDNLPHVCKPPKVRKYTKEEIERMNIERGFKQPMKGET